MAISMKRRAPPGVNGVDEFDELFQWGGLGVEFGQGRIHGGKTQGGVRAAETAHAGIGGGRGMDGANSWMMRHPRWPMMKSSSPIRSRKVPEGGMTVKPASSQIFDRRIDRRHAPVLVGTELADKGIVDDVGTTGVGRRHIDDGVGSRRPQRIGAVQAQKISLGLEMAHLGEGHGNAVAPLAVIRHGDVVPAASEWIFLALPPGARFPCAGTGHVPEWCATKPAPAMRSVPSNER